MKPVRIQLRRSKGWRKPAGAVVVSRPSKWGNPFKVQPGRTREKAIELFRGHLQHNPMDQFDRMRRSLVELRGKDLACWCQLGKPCHADVLLELANQ